MKKRILQFRMKTEMMIMLLLVVAGMTKVFAQNITVGDLNYSVNSDGTTVTIRGHVDGTSASGTLAIPPSISYEGNLYAVTAISGYSFHNCVGLTGAITLPNSIVTIGDNAFNGCTNISELTIGEGVVSIGTKAFWNCSSLNIVHFNAVNCNTMYSTEYSSVFSVFGVTPEITELTIGSNVQTIPSYAFYRCMNISGQLVIPNSVTTIGNSAFSVCSGFSGELVIPNSVISIGYSAFSNCSGFSGDLIIPNSVTNIGSSAFLYCTGFTGVLQIGSSMTSIESETFSSCSGFSSIIIPDSITEIGSFAFYGCSSLSSFNIPNSVEAIKWEVFNNTGWYNNQPDGVLYLDGWCLGFKGDPSEFESIIIQEGTLHISDAAFTNCRGLTSVVLPNSLVYISEMAFEGCEHLSSVVFGNSLTSIGNNAFSMCSGLHSLELPNSLLRIENGAFWQSGLHSIVIPDAVTYVGENAFELCYMHTITIGSSVTEIGNNAFASCEGLRNVFSYASTPPTFGEDVFINDGLYNTFTLYVPENVISDYQNSSIGAVFSDILPMTEIDNLIYTYDNTELLAKVIGCRREYYGELNIPSSILYNGNTYSVYSVGDAAFYENAKITTLSIPNTIVTIGEFAFYYCDKLIGKLIIPNSVTNIGRYAFSYCSGFIDDLIIPNSVITIGASAFSECNGLDGSLIIGNSITNIGAYAFVGCSGIKAIWSKCETPPSTGWYPFSGIDRNNPVYVPCGSQSAYESASYWKVFTNYHESPYYLVAKPSSEYYGEAIVFQYSDCENNESIVHAESYFGANFTGWTIDGELVSTETDYSFSLDEDIILTANFEPNSNHYVFVGSTNLWNEPDNWLPTEVPDETSTVGIWTNVEVDENVSVNSIVIYGDNTLTILPNHSLTVTDTLVTPNASSLVINERGELFHSCDGVLATVEKSIMPFTEGEQDGWSLLALPLAGSHEISSIGNLTEDEYDLYYYDEPTASWINQKETDTDFHQLEAGKGYLYANKGEMRMRYGFEEGLEGWTTISPEGNSSSWHHVTNAFGSHSGEGHISSAIAYHYENGNYYSDDNYIVSPLVQFTSSSSISFWVYNTDWIYEHFAVAVSTSGNTDASDFTTIQEFVPFEKSKADGDSLRGADNWRQYTVDLSLYAGQTGYIAIHHYECTDMQHTLRIDDIELDGMDNLRNAVPFSFTGALENGSASMNIPLSYSGGNKLSGFNLIGNPFPCNAYLNREYYILTTDGTDINPEPIPATTPIPPCTAVFVKAVAEGETVVFTRVAP